MARKPSVFFHRVQSLLKYALLGASLTLFILLGHGEANLKPFLTSLPLLKVGILPVSAQSQIDAPQLIEEGRKFYEKGDFSDAVRLWQQAARLFAIQEDRLDRAQVLSFISLAYQQLGQWGKAEEAIRDSLNLLRTEENSPTLAQALTNKGHLQLALGKAEEALKTWQQATDIYAYLKDETGVTGSLVNQSLAMQELGLYRRACQTLLPALKLENSFCNLSSETEQPIFEQLDSLKSAITKQPDSLVRGVGLRSLGDVLRVIGKLEESQQVLQQSLEMAKRLNSSMDISAVNLSLGNTKRALYNRNKDLFDRSGLPNDRKKVGDIAEEALSYYQQVVKEGTTNSILEITLIQAQLNHLSLLLDFSQWSKNKQPYFSLENIQLQIQSLVNELFNQSIVTSLPPNQETSLPPNQEIVYARLNFAQSLIQLVQLESNKEFKQAAFQQIQEAIQQAKGLKNQRAKAYAFGILGYFYEQFGELSLAQQETYQALGIAQSIYALDIAYQWQWQLGRIYEKLKNPEKYYDAYDAAVKTLELVRQDLLTTNPDVKFSFRDNVKPVYQQFLKLLLQSEKPSEDSVKKAVEVNGQLQLAELENFLRCGLRDLVPLDEVKNLPTVIHTIVLDDRIDVIVQAHQLPLHHHRVLESLQEVEITVKELSIYLSKSGFTKEQVLNHAQKLYNWLIKPAKDALPETGKTLVFVLDSSLQKIPMAILHDGNQYLVEKYSIALTLGSQLREPKTLPPEQLRALTAGAKEAPSFFFTKPPFPALQSIEDELNELKDNKISRQELRNKDFTRDKFLTEINTSNLPVIHVATHGQFSSDPEKTFILAYDLPPIDIRQLDRSLRRRTQGSLNSIELLVLSACQTAEGDKWAALGIAGVAAQAGARSTLATLWSVNDDSTAELIDLFYQQLKAGETKAKALQYAQKKLLPKYDPYKWAAFVLVGSWL